MVVSILLVAISLFESQNLNREVMNVWLCPLHQDEQATLLMKCPVCDTEMVERALVSSYSCPMHLNIDEVNEGKCPICRMGLVSTVRELQWFCPDSPQLVSSVPKMCTDGTPMEVRSLPMAHGDHNPKHGGILFMAPDGYHHLEGTLSADGEFRLYLYNDFTQPLKTTRFMARIDSFALESSTQENYLVSGTNLTSEYPVEIVLYVHFPEAHGTEARFDFVFTETMVMGGLAEDNLILPEFRIPETADGIFEEIMERDARIRYLIANGVWPDLYIPALEAKDLVLALVEKENARLAHPGKKMVRAAWLLDVYGDMGNRVEVEKAYQLFNQSIRELKAAREN